MNHMPTKRKWTKPKAAETVPVTHASLEPKLSQDKLADSICTSSSEPLVSEGTTESDVQIQVTLLRCKKTKRVLYMEAGKDFVDLLISFLEISTGTVVNLLRRFKALGGLVNVVTSILTMDDSVLLLDRSVLGNTKEVTAKNWNELAVHYYLCDSGWNCLTVSLEKDLKCSGGCGGSMTREAKKVPHLLRQPQNKGPFKKNATDFVQGYVKDNVTFMISDDLQITPSSVIKGISLLNKLNVSFQDLESRELSIGPIEVKFRFNSYLAKCVGSKDVLSLGHHIPAMQLLGAAVSSSSVLNDVFKDTWR